MKDKKTEQIELDRYAEKLLQARSFSHEGESSDAVFLARFRNKLEESKNRRAKAANLISDWSWKASPVAALVSAMLIITLFSMGNNTETTDTSSLDELLWKSAAVENSEISQEQFLEVLFFGNSGR